jgi:hypothetical protein
MWTPSQQQHDDLNLKYERRKAHEANRAERAKQAARDKLIHRIEKQKLQCREELMKYYEEHGNFPKNFKCSFTKLDEMYDSNIGARVRLYEQLPNVVSRYPIGTISYKDTGVKTLCKGGNYDCAEIRGGTFEVSINNLN